MARLPYPNGEIPYDKMMHMGGNDYAHPAAGAAFRRMNDALFKATGYRLGYSEIYRPKGQPSDYDNDQGNTQWYYWIRKQRNPGAPVAAYPGDSKHGLGLAFDLIGYSQPGVWAWMQAHADEYGFSWAEGKASDEDWHWVYVGDLDYDWAAEDDVELIDETTEEDYGMATIYKSTSAAGYIPEGWSFLQGDDGALRALSAREYEAYIYAHPKAIVVDYKGEDLLALARSNGIYEYTGDSSTGPQGLTGRIIGRTADKNNAGGSDHRHFPYSEGGKDPLNP